MKIHSVCKVMVQSILEGSIPETQVPLATRARLSRGVPCVNCMHLLVLVGPWGKHWAGANLPIRFSRTGPQESTRAGQVALAR